MARDEQPKRTEADWCSQLTPEQYHVTREGGTERAFTGRYWNEKRPGTYSCVCCGVRLFESDTKYESGSGWPSFWQPAEGGTIEEHSDVSYGMVRTEIRCARCQAHLGHVFEDGPPPTGLRYCVNSAALEFQPREEER